MNSIQWNRKAVKQLKKLQKKDQHVVVDAVENLADFPDCQGVKSLKKHSYQYRLRVGRYRVFFDFESEIKIVSIEEVKKRDERTY